MRNTYQADILGNDVARLRQLLVNVGRRYALRDPIAASCEDMDLTPTQLHAVAWLGTEGMLSMGELARRVGVTDKTITGVVDRLEESSLLQRDRDADDRRLVRVRLTRKGAAVAARISTHLDEGMGAALALLAPADREALFRVLEKLVDRLADGRGAQP